MRALLICPRRFEDRRGWFSETWNRDKLAAQGIDIEFCQDNQSFSVQRGTLRGLHFQTAPFAQTKLVRCTKGRLLDVAVDVRRQSPTFGKYVQVELSAANGKQLLIPAGYAHGFLTLEDETEIAYTVDAPYSAANDGGIAWDDPDIAIDWPTDAPPVLSDKDARLPRLRDLAIEFAYDGEPLGDLTEIIM